jgi:hypothetical protein
METGGRILPGNAQRIPPRGKKTPLCALGGSSGESVSATETMQQAMTNQTMFPRKTNHLHSFYFQSKTRQRQEEMKEQEELTRRVGSSNARPQKEPPDNRDRDHLPPQKKSATVAVVFVVCLCCVLWSHLVAVTRCVKKGARRKP